MIGTGSTPVSAMRPANTDTYAAGPSAIDPRRRRATCSSVIIAVTLPSRRSAARLA